MSSENAKYLLQEFSFKKLNTRILSYLALFIAFTAVATYIHFPGPGTSYFNLGEVAIYIIALTFGRKAGGLAGAVGSALIDILLGYSIWAPFTFIIKGLEGYLIGKLAEEGNWKRNVLAIIVGGHIMILGYALSVLYLYSWPAVLPEIGIDYGQMLIGGLIALPIARQLNKYFGK